jgi:hypothetical protein
MLAFLALFVLLAAAAVWFLNSEWMDIDRCLDGGGRWDKASKQCQFASGEMN